MLKKRSGAVCSKKDLMSDHTSHPSPATKSRNKPKGLSGTEAASPTFILETKPFSVAGRYFIFDSKSKACSSASSEIKIHPWDGRDSKIVGLGIVDALNKDEADKKYSNADSSMVLFGSQLKVQSPPAGRNCDRHSTIEYGIKNKNSQLALSLLSPARRLSLAPAAAPTSEPSPSVLCLSPSEMELSEDYTRVIARGPNPKTIHIFDTSNLARSGNGFSPFQREINFSAHGSSASPSNDFLAFCQSCRKKLGQGKDTFMYRGEKAFCSHECRSREMLFDDEMEDSTACQ